MNGGALVRDADTYSRKNCSKQIRFSYFSIRLHSTLYIVLQIKRKKNGMCQMVRTSRTTRKQFENRGWSLHL